MLRYVHSGHNLGDRPATASTSDVQTVVRARPHHRAAVHARRPLEPVPALPVTLACAATFAVGAWLRLWVLVHVPFSSDEAVVGLVAERHP